MEDRHFMEMALELAAGGRGRTSPNPMVGAIAVRDGIIVGKGKIVDEGHRPAGITAGRGSGARGRQFYPRCGLCLIAVCGQTGL